MTRLISKAIKRRQLSGKSREVWAGRRLVFVFWALIWALGACGEQVRSVRGTVIDQTGHVLAGAVVQIQDRTTFQVRSYVTGGDGAFHFGDLSPDLTYHLRASYLGVFSRSKTLSKFDSKSVGAIDLTIHLVK